MVFDKEKCCGCGLCAGCCPLKAIEMNSDEKGFLYPIINMDLCVKCGICDNVCAFSDRKLSDEIVMPTYTAA